MASLTYIPDKKTPCFPIHTTILVCFLFIFCFFFPKSSQEINVGVNLRLGRVVGFVKTGKKSTRLQSKSSTKNRMQKTAESMAILV